MEDGYVKKEWPGPNFYIIYLTEKGLYEIGEL